ncbi:hypothetical protein CEXT_119591 [Caerostris extrusa]|uniref:Uncharacterized protein n=1 Tax=Caerostris extrusa TaxID=172846 RepID=A0AAV4RS53_CAEEX|nr:hypothetical protein CEXT_119591 [Caerostris extrusa]
MIAKIKTSKIRQKSQEHIYFPSNRSITNKRRITKPEIKIKGAYTFLKAKASLIKPTSCPRIHYQKLREQKTVISSRENPISVSKKHFRLAHISIMPSKIILSEFFFPTTNDPFLLETEP